MTDQNINQPPPLTDTSQDDLGIALKIVSFCIPLVGAILYFVKKKDKPVSAKQACTFALYGVAVGIIINIIVAIIN
jgi:hypothetical protein